MSWWQIQYVQVRPWRGKAVAVMVAAYAAAGLAVGSVSRWLRPYGRVGSIHWEAIAALALLSLLCLWALFRQRRRPIKGALLSLEGELAALWLGFLIGWSILHGSLWEDMVQVCAGSWLASAAAGATLQALVHWRRRPAELAACRRCGYSLLGLTQPRCPECGSVFDPVEMKLEMAGGSYQSAAGGDVRVG